MEKNTNVGCVQQAGVNLFTNYIKTFLYFSAGIVLLLKSQKEQS
jgi:hypothetical protein